MNIFARSTPSMCIFSTPHCHFSFYVTQICRITLFSFRLYLAIATHFDTFLLLSEGNEILIYTPFLMTKTRFWNIRFPLGLDGVGIESIEDWNIQNLKCMFRLFSDWNIQRLKYSVIEKGSDCLCIIYRLLFMKLKRFRYWTPKHFKIPFQAWMFWQLNQN